MSLRPRTADALIGALVLGAIIVFLVALVITRGWTERRVVVYMLSSSVQDLNVQTPVKLQGLTIGEVKEISPLPDSGERMGPPVFVVALRLRESYANGMPIRMPLGTRAEISSSGLIGNAVISLIVPESHIKAALQPGDTIRGTLTEGWTDVLKEVADTLRTQVSGILSKTNRLLATLDKTAGNANDELAKTGPEIRNTLAGARSVLDRLEPVLAQTSRTMSRADTTMATMQDSLLTLVADTRRLLNHADTLTTNINGLTTDLAPDIRVTLKTMRVMSAKMEYFMDQVSRRPHRLLTGIHPISRDSILAEPSAP